MSTHLFKTQDIRGKNYVPVNERIKYLDTYYRGRYSLTSEATYLEKLNGWMVKATLTLVDSDGVMQTYTGHGLEVIGDGMVNKTSAAENAETSAWGRACAAAGIGIDTSIASSEEVSNAIAIQEKTVVPAPNAEKQEAVNTDLLEKQKDHLAMLLLNTAIRSDEAVKATKAMEYANETKMKLLIARVEKLISERSKDKTAEA